MAWPAQRFRLGISRFVVVICLASVAQVALAEGLVAPIQLEGKWQSNTGSRSGPIILQIDRIETSGEFAGKLYFLRAIHCIARGELVANGRISQTEMTFSSQGGSSKLCGGLVFHLKFGGAKLLEGWTEFGLSVWLERSGYLTATPESTPTNAFVNVDELRQAGGRALNQEEALRLLTGARIRFPYRASIRTNVNRPNGDLWVSFVNPIGRTNSNVGDWRVNERGAYCVKVQYAFLEDFCQRVWGLEGKYYLYAESRFVPITFIE